MVMVFIWTSAKLIKAPNDERHCIDDETNQPTSETEETEEGSADPAITSPASGGAMAPQFHATTWRTLKSWMGVTPSW